MRLIRHPLHLRMARPVLWVLTAAVLSPPGSMQAESLREPVVVLGDSSMAPALVVDPSTIVLGRTRQVLLEVRVPLDARDGALRGAVSVGRLNPFELVEPGLYRAEYEPPQRRFPQMAALVLWRDHQHDSAVVVYRLPLLGTARLPVLTSPGAEIVVVANGRRFGPFHADDDGRVEARLTVPPAARYALVQALNDRGDATSERVDLGVPSFNRLTAFVLPSQVVSDGESTVQLYVHYEHFGRSLPAVADIAIETSLDERSPLKQLEGGLFEVTYALPLSTEDRELRFRATVSSDPASSVELTLHAAGHVLEESEDPVEVDSVDPLASIEFLRLVPPEVEIDEAEQGEPEEAPTFLVDLEASRQMVEQEPVDRRLYERWWFWGALASALLVGSGAAYAASLEGVVLIEPQGTLGRVDWR